MLTDTPEGCLWVLFVEIAGRNLSYQSKKRMRGTWGAEFSVGVALEEAGVACRFPEQSAYVKGWQFGEGPRSSFYSSS